MSTQSSQYSVGSSIFSFRLATPGPSRARATTLPAMDPVLSQVPTVLVGASQASQASQVAPDQPDEDAPGRQIQASGNNFRWGAKQYFLTYSQVGDRDINLVSELLRSKGVAKFFAVCESHRNGGKHWHVMAFWDKPFRGRGARALDIDGIHPNIKVMPTKKDVERVWDYVNKDATAPRIGDYTGPFKVKPRVMDPTVAWQKVRECTNKEDAIETLFALDPRSYFLYRNQWEAGFSKHFQEKTEAYQSTRTREDFPWVTDAMKDWVASYIDAEQCPERPKALVIYGPTRLGKTEWARVLGHHMYHNGMFNMDNWDDDAQYIIFDDVQEKSMAGHYKQWFGAQKEFTVTDKYRPKTTVRWGRPMIWLSNSDPRDSLFFDRAWLEGNCVFIHLTHKLYGPDPPDGFGVEVPPPPPAPTPPGVAYITDYPVPDPFDHGGRRARRGEVDS